MRSRLTGSPTSGLQQVLQEATATAKQDIQATKMVTNAALSLLFLSLTCAHQLR
jgi:hypothetical protein